MPSRVCSMPVIRYDITINITDFSSLSWCRSEFDQFFSREFQAGFHTIQAPRHHLVPCSGTRKEPDPDRLTTISENTTPFLRLSAVLLRTIECFSYSCPTFDTIQHNHTYRTYIEVHYFKFLSLLPHSYTSTSLRSFLPVGRVKRLPRCTVAHLHL
ncbi:hypothetical protein CONLIGDRAFT_321105 [Coniochaeta ligniaria NRRL 30616]|uniref:Uncharacterized protein n=1 Tax=Coniochaeta ligniaria NRRL 30616 TaxID=1408157 RepID=A0A1J7JNM0_9PEZI|nr:hypothetical protein CONLIGDRAFT_321105 [Coniochaeta ligniaria NRRL 30616]